MNHANQRATLLTAVLLFSLFIASSYASQFGGYTSSTSQPCRSNFQTNYYYQQTDCGDLTFQTASATFSSLGGTVAQGASANVIFASNLSSINNCAGCLAVLVYVPPGNAVTYTNEPALYNLPNCPTSGTYPTGNQCIVATKTILQQQSVPDSQITITGPVLTTSPGQNVYDAYIANTTAQTTGPSISDPCQSNPCYPLWTATGTIAIGDSSGVVASLTLNPYILPDAATNVTTIVSGLPSTITSMAFDSDLFFAVASQGDPLQPPLCPSKLSNIPQCSSSSNPYSSGTACWQSAVSTPPDSNSNPSCSGTSCNIDTMTGFGQPSYAYSFCVYFSGDALSTDAALIGSSTYTVNTYLANSYGLLFTNSTQAFLLGNATVLQIAPTFIYTSTSATQGDVCGLADGGDHCGILFAGPLGSSQCKSPWSYSISSGTPSWSHISYCTNPVNPNGGACLLNTFTNTYQNENNATYSQILNTQYIANGNYLLCAYNMMPIDWLQGTSPGGVQVFMSPFFASAVLTCANGICRTVSSVQQLLPPPCINCGFNSTTGSVNAYNGIALTSFGSAACGIYGSINAILFIFALVLMLLGAVLYAGSSILPGYTRGMAQSYAFGFVLVGIIAVVISSVSFWALSIAGSNSIINTISLCA